MDCIRVSVDFLDREDLVDELIEGLGRAPGLVSEWALFTNYYHCARTLEYLQDVADKMARLIPRIRAAGYRAGINHLTTVGHHNEYLQVAVDDSLRRQVGLDGQCSEGALCPADPLVQEYVRRTYEILAAAGPDFIWIDDDVRYSGHMPTAGCCLCELCVEEFSHLMGESFTHASLVAALDDPDFGRRSTTRRRFMERNSQIIRQLFVLIEQATHKIDPRIELGFMTGDRFWEGYGFTAWAEALRGDARVPVRWRPGGGYYTDANPHELIDKVNDVGRQVAALPAYVDIIQAEIENFPYQPLRKATQSNALEMTGYLFAGCTGNALNILSGEANGLSEHLPLIQRLHRCVPFWDRLKVELTGSRLVGVWPAWDGLQIAAGAEGGSTSHFHDIQHDMRLPYSLQDLGVPICYREEYAAAVALAGRMPLALGPERMRGLLAGGVLLDTGALQSLQAMGLAELAGVTAGQEHAWDTVEVFAEHRLNGADAGKARDCRQSFNRLTAHELVPASDSVEVLSRMRGYDGSDRGPCVTCFENTLGGRVAVMSYFPWTLNGSQYKRRQTNSICAWLAGGAMPMTIHTVSRITPWVRRKQNGALVIGLLNLGADTYDTVALTINTDRRRAQRVRMDGVIEDLQAASSGAALHVELDHVDPCSFELLLCA